MAFAMLQLCNHYVFHSCNTKVKSEKLEKYQQIPSVGCNSRTKVLIDEQKKVLMECQKETAKVVSLDCPQKVIRKELIKYKSGEFL